MRRTIPALLMLLLPACVQAEVFVAPSGGVLYIKCVGGSAGGTSQFGTGTSVSTFVSFLSPVPQSCATTEVAVGSVIAGQSVPFGIHTQWNGSDYWAFSTGTDPASLVSFTDVNNDLGMGGKIIQSTGQNTWVMHLNDAAHYTLGSDESNNILIQLRLSPGSASPPPPTGGVFVAPSSGTLYLTCIGGSAGTTSQFGIGSSPSTFVPYFNPVPQSCPTAEVSAGTVTAGEIVPFGIETMFGQTYWAFSTGTDQGSVVAFTDINDSLGLGGNAIVPTGSETWVLHLNDAAHYILSNAEANNIIIQLRLEPSATVTAPTITGIGNAASYQPGISPGMLATLFGQNLSPVVGLASPGGATSYQGMFVTVGGRPAPLFTILNVNGAQQVNFQVPTEVSAPTVIVQVNNNGAVGSMSVPLTAVQPGIFQYIPTGSGISYAAIVNSDGSVMSPSNPASRGSTVAMFLTGLGPTTPLVGTGQPGPIPPATTKYQPVIIGLNDGGVQASFSGIAPGFVGLDQVNFTIPTDAPVGKAISFAVSINGVSSQSSAIAIQ